MLKHNLRDRAMLLIRRVAGKHIVIRQEPFQFDEAGVDLLAPLVQFVRLVAEPFVLRDQSRFVWRRHGRTRAMKKGAPDTAPLLPPPLLRLDQSSSNFVNSGFTLFVDG